MILIMQPTEEDMTRIIGVIRDGGLDKKYRAASAIADALSFATGATTYTPDRFIAFHVTPLTKQAPDIFDFCTYGPEAVTVVHLTHPEVVKGNRERAYADLYEWEIREVPSDGQDHTLGRPCDKCSIIRGQAAPGDPKEAER